MFHWGLILEAQVRDEEMEITLKVIIRTVFQEF